MEGGEYRITGGIQAMIEIVHRNIDAFLLLVLLPFVVAQLLDHVV